MAQPNIAIPGQPLASAAKYSPGFGTHISNDHVVSSIIGQTMPTRAKQRSSRPLLTVNRPTYPASRPVPLLPTVGIPVYIRITRIAQTMAHGFIIVIKDTVAPHPFRGIIRSIDVRATEKDKVKLIECFKVSDIVRAVVISLGDQGGYYLSTAGNEYGVVMAWSEQGNSCVPVSWNQVKDEITGEKEPRKVAKPF